MKRKLFLFLLVAFYSHISLAQNMQFHGFANVDFKGAFPDHMPNQNYFTLGQYDFFITAQPTEKISMLGESVFEYDGDFGVDIERVIIKYQINDHFNLQAGKFHTPLGYWNNAYHHGSSIQPVTARPDPINFEDNGGILPVHETGLEINGEHFTKADIGFNLLVSNGLSATPVFDDNTHKAMTFQVHAEPIDGLHLIVSGFKDNLDSGAVKMPEFQAYKSGDMMIMNGSIAYLGSKIPLEFIGEYYNIANTVDSVGPRTSTAMIGYVGFRMKKITPYACYTSMTFGEGQTYFTKNNSSRITVGVRYRFSTQAVLKFEYQMYHENTIGNSQIAYAQIAIGF